MFPKITAVTAGLAAALVIGVPAAFGQSEGFDREQNRANLTPSSPDVVERTIAAKQLELSGMLDARERALGVRNETQRKVSSLDARERAFQAKLQVQLGSGSYPDAFERAMVAREPTRQYVGDERFRIDPTSVATPMSVTSSGNEIEWPQVAIGFGIGVALMFGLWLALRVTRIRQLAH
jgi:hypothetical protein